jgi:hypothetical protein
MPTTTEAIMPAEDFIASLTSGQRRALDQYFARYEIEMSNPSEKFDLFQLRGRFSPVAQPKLATIILADSHGLIYQFEQMALTNIEPLSIVHAPDPLVPFAADQEAELARRRQEHIEGLEKAVAQEEMVTDLNAPIRTPWHWDGVPVAPEVMNSTRGPVTVPPRGSGNPVSSPAPPPRK